MAESLTLAEKAGVDSEAALSLLNGQSSCRLAKPVAPNAHGFLDLFPAPM